MPLGAFRINTLSKVLVTTPAAETIDAVSIPASTNYANTSTSFGGSGQNLTIAFSFKSDTDPANYSRFVSIRQGSTNTFFTVMRDNSNQKLAFYSANQGSSPNVRWWFVADVGSSMFDGNWHHIMVATDQSSTSNSRIYWDGVSKTITHNNTNSSGAINWSSYDNIGIGGRAAGTNRTQGDYAQFFIDDIYENDITKFYDTTNNKAIDLGVSGTATGLDQPRIYHHGNTSTFTTNAGTDSYTLSTVGSGTITDATGPESVASTRTDAAVGITMVDNAHISTDQAKFGSTSVELDGTNDAVDPDHANLNIGSGDFTVEWFYYPTDLSTVYGRYFFDTGSGVSGRLNGYFNSSSQFVIRSGNSVLLQASHGMSTGQWYHLAIVRKNGTLKFYRDGTELASTSNSTNFTNNDYKIGSYLTGGGFGLIGYIDEWRQSDVARYSQAFTAPTSAFVADGNTKLLLHFEGSNNDTTTTDDGPRALSLWSNGGWTQTSGGVFGNALQLSPGGSHAYLNILPGGAEFDDDQTITVEFRFKISNGGQNSLTTKLFSTSGLNSNGFPPSTNQITLHTFSDANLYLTHDTGETNMGNPGTGWHHIAMQYNGTGSFHCWLDGTHKISATHTINPTTNLFFGNRQPGEGTNNGTNYIDEIRVSSITRYTHSTSNITVPTSAFTNDDDTIALFHCETTTQTDDAG